MFAFVFSSLVLLPFVFAATINVDVGDGKLLFSPEAIFATPGDSVVFHFHPKNHSVTQSSFANPCGLKAGGFNSGFNPVASNQSSETLPTYTVLVNDTEPIWVYCAQNLNLPTSHCGAGMVFAINCGADGAPNSFTNFKKSALAYGANLSAPPSSYTTAAYGGYTIPAAPTPIPTTKVITLGSKVWTTTYASYPNSPDPTPVSPEGQVHTVKVGSDNKLEYSPSRVSARPLDVIRFVFYSKNHTVTQSSFGDPCRPYSLNGTKGFDSGFKPVPANTATSDLPTFDYIVTDTSPTWAYCQQGNHCGSGMVFAINSDENSTRSIQGFQNVAKMANGTALAAAPSSPSSPSSSARANVGSAGWILFVAGVLGAML